MNASDIALANAMTRDDALKAAHVAANDAAYKAAYNAACAAYEAEVARINEEYPQ